MNDWKTPCCNIEPVMGHQYGYTRDTQEHYDGVSEWICSCGKRYGRWSKRELQDGFIERRYGGEPVKVEVHR